MVLLRNDGARRLWSWLGANVVFALCHPAAATLGVPAVMRAAGVALVLMWLPGAAWNAVWPGGPRREGAQVATTLAWATLLFFTVIAASAAVGHIPTDRSLWLSLWIITNAGWAVAHLQRRGGSVARRWPKRHAAAGVVSGGLAFLLFFWGATRVVPPLEDQDLEVTGTGYALLTRFEPLLLTDRNSTYFFAHPPLLHFYVAGAHVLGGAMDHLRFYFDGSRRVRDAWEYGVPPNRTGRVRVTGHPAPLPVPAGDYRIVGATTDAYELASVAADGQSVSVPIAAVELDEIYAHYTQQARPVDTRTINVFFGAVTVGLLVVWAGRLTGRLWFGVGLAAVYATCPEVFVRSSYGGYFAIGALASLLMLLADQQWRRTQAPGLPFLVGVGTALADHKLVVLPLVMGVMTFWSLGNPDRRGWARLHPVALGFLAGTALFWTWGALVAPIDFVQDHLRGHLLDRVRHYNPFGYEGYPTVVGLWTEFVRTTGVVLVPAAVLLFSVDWWRHRRTRADASSTMLTMWWCWIALTAVVFSVVDWRMTKHLAVLVIPLLLTLAPTRRAPRWRVVAATAVVVVLLALNVRSIATLANDFHSVVVTPLW